MSTVRDDSPGEAVEMQSYPVRTGDKYGRTSGWEKRNREYLF